MKDVRQLGSVLQDAEPPASSAILRKSKSLGTNSTSSIHKNCAASGKHPLNKIQVKLPHQRSPFAVKFEDTSQEETERQERCARGDAWRLAKHIFSFMDSGGSMHMVSRQDLVSADLETVGHTKNLTTVVTADGEVLIQCMSKNRIYSWQLCFWKIHWLFSHSENSAKITGIITIGPVVTNHISSKKARRSIAIRRTSYKSLSLVYRQAPQAHLHLLLHLHRRKP